MRSSATLLGLALSNLAWLLGATPALPMRIAFELSGGEGVGDFNKAGRGVHLFECAAP